LLKLDTKLTSQQNVKEDKKDKKKLGSLKTISVKKFDPKFAPLYYRRFYFKINKDAKTFNYAIYFAMINTLYALKIFYACVTLISLFVDELAQISGELYFQAKTSKKIMCYLHLFEFFLLLQAYILISLKNYDRALYELVRIDTPINEYNTLLYRIMSGLCYSHCHYYELAIYNLCEASQMIRPLLEANKEIDDTDQMVKKADREKEKKKSLEGIYATYIKHTLLK
jgi:hypothetical protein